MCIFIFCRHASPYVCDFGVWDLARIEIHSHCVYITHLLLQSITQTETSIDDSSQKHIGLAAHIGVFVLSGAETLGKYPLQLQKGVKRLSSAFGFKHWRNVERNPGIYLLTTVNLQGLPYIIHKALSMFWICFICFLYDIRCDYKFWSLGSKKWNVRV